MRTSLSVFTALLCLAVLNAEEQKPARSSAILEKAENDASQPAEPEKAPANMPSFPLKSPYWTGVLDAYEFPQDAQMLELEVLEDVLRGVKYSSQTHLNANINAKATYENLMLKPDAFRGHVASYDGIVRNVEKIRLKHNQLGVAEMWQGQISPAGSSAMMTFLSLEEPQKVENQPVNITGVFLKRFAFANQMPGNHITWTPMIVVKSLQPANPAAATKVASAETRMDLYAVLAGGFAVTAVSAYFLGRAAFRSKKGSENA